MQGNNDLKEYGRGNKIQKIRGGARGGAEEGGEAVVTDVIVLHGGISVSHGLFNTWHVFATSFVIVFHVFISVSHGLFSTLSSVTHVMVLHVGI